MSPFASKEGGKQESWIGRKLARGALSAENGNIREAAKRVAPGNCALSLLLLLLLLLGGRGRWKAMEKRCPRAPRNRFQLAKLSRPRTFLWVPFTWRGPRGRSANTRPFSLPSVDFNWQNSRNAWTMFHPSIRREIESNWTHDSDFPSWLGLPLEAK